MNLVHDGTSHTGERLFIISSRIKINTFKFPSLFH